MIYSIKKLSENERRICNQTISSKAIYALIGDAILRKESISVVRMGDGERHILSATDESIFTILEERHPDWRKRLGIEGLSIDSIKENILEAGNTCTYFAPSISGVFLSRYNLYDFFNARDLYFDNFFVNDWTKVMIQHLLEMSDGVYIIHNDYKKVIENFNKNYGAGIGCDGFSKTSWSDNNAAIEAAVRSDAQLILFSAGPAGKIIGPRIALAENKVVLDIGNTLLSWSEKVV